MDRWLDIPQGRRRLPFYRICMILGCTALVYLVVAPRVFSAIVLNVEIFSP